MRQTKTAAENVIPFQAQKESAEPIAEGERFKIIPFKNESGSTSYRVTGIKRNGDRVRSNYAEEKAARCKWVELETEWLTGKVTTEVRATQLTEKQIRLAETAFLRLDNDDEMPLAVEHWIRHGRQQAVQESPRLDQAFDKFKAWLPQSGMRELSQANLKRRVNVFANSVPNLRVSDFTPETIESFLAGRGEISAKSKDNDRRAVSRFFSWCIERPRKWAAMNPCHEVKVAQGEKAPPFILTLEQCKAIMKQSEAHKDGQLAPYFAVCLFGGLRPFEAARVTWDQVNLVDDEIRLEAAQVKTGRKTGGRVVAICDTLKAWLKAYEGKPFYPTNWRRDFDAVVRVIGFGRKTKTRPNLKPWPVDALRHTAVSHFFRKAGSYGLTAEQFGNSEAVIKAHYQGRVSSADTAKFYAIKPSKH